MVLISMNCLNYIWKIEFDIAIILFDALCDIYDISYVANIGLHMYKVHVQDLKVLV